MKKGIFSLMIGAIVALSSCSKSDEQPTVPQQGDQLVAFTVEAPALTRSTVNGLSRYIVEAYESKKLDATPQRAESADGTLQLTLKKNTEYTFVFWADYGTAAVGATPGSGYWDATSLNAVKVSDGKENTAGQAAYCLVKEFNSKDFEANKTVVLKNATAQVNFVEAAGLLTTDNTLTVTYTQSATLNAATGTVTEVAGDAIHTFTGIAQVAKDGTLATDYVLASRDDKSVANIKVQLNSETEKAIDNVPFQQNYKTNIKGEYSNLYASTFTISNEVEDYENNDDVEFPKAKVGDYFYEDGTYSSTYTNNAANPCIGIVFLVNADGKSGKIVGLDGPDANWNSSGNTAGKLIWGPNTTTNARDELNGLKNMHAVKTAGSGTFDAYPVFKWADSKNSANTDYSTATTGVWYLPATKEFRQLYAAMSGLKWVESGAIAANGEINDWTLAMDNYADYATARSTFDGLFTAAGKVPMGQNYFWTSTENNNINIWSMGFTGGGTYISPKDFTDNRLRCVRAF